MADQTCKTCHASVAEDKARAHADWHRDLDERITKAVKDGIAAWDRETLRKAQMRGIGGF